MFEMTFPVTLVALPYSKSIKAPRANESKLLAIKSIPISFTMIVCIYVFGLNNLLNNPINISLGTFMPASTKALANL